MPEPDSSSRTSRISGEESVEEAGGRVREAGEPSREDAHEDAPGETRERGQEGDQERDRERRSRRAAFLRELSEARALRDRVQPRRAKSVRLRQQMRMRTFRW